MTGSKWSSCLLTAEYDQGHLLEGKTEEELAPLYRDLDKIESVYPGGLASYLKRARVLLKESKEGGNPFEGFYPSPPPCEAPVIGSEEFYSLEQLGSDLVSQCGFVLVAGGLGERLGYPDIKISILTNITEEISYAEYYCRYIRKFQGSSVIPLAIMTSGDTHEATVALFESNNYFGLKKSQVTIMMQEKVPALCDADAHLVADENNRLLTKPHGHGDVHTLIHQRKLHTQWKDQGIKYIFFFQDTNALSMRALPVMLGVSHKKSFAMNSLCVPRLPGEAVGGICHLKNPSTGDELVVNVEYNMLSGLLANAGLGGDVAAPGSKHSIFPGNCNILVFNLEAYSEILEKTGGTVPEFVNPKYADANKIKFKSPTRLECMMQDYARLFGKQHTVGCTTLDRWFCFSTVKNNMTDAAAKLSSGGSGESAFTAECDLYQANVNCLRHACKKSGTSLECPEPVDATYKSMKYPLGARLYIDPTWAATISEMAENLKGTKSITMTKDSSCVLGGGIRFESLDVSGEIVLKGGMTDEVQCGAVICKGAPRQWQESTEADPLKYTVRGYRYSHEL